MKKLILFLIAALTIVTSGCAKHGNTEQLPETERKRVIVEPFEGVDTGSSALMLYKYDGESTAVFYLFDAEQEREIIDLFNDIPLYEADIYEVTELPGSPAYALSIYGEEGERALTWIESFCIDETGGAYFSDLTNSAEYFEKLLTDYPWEDHEYKREGNSLPNLYYLANRGEWDVKYLNKAKEPPHGTVSFEITDVGESITTIISNNTSEEITFGLESRIQVQIDGEWYELPTKRTLFTPAIAYVLPDGGSKEMTYDRSFRYGELPSGAYRLVTGHGTAEFEIE
ncbi:MAG: hypothetical protein K2G32_09440 [Oscillospiraceae bacterium]|nr:hypothetical protein [Oscillospiraceae bacterium]